MNKVIAVRRSQIDGIPAHYVILRQNGIRFYYNVPYMRDGLLQRLCSEKRCQISISMDHVWGFDE